MHPTRAATLLAVLGAALIAAALLLRALSFGEAVALAAQNGDEDAPEQYAPALGGYVIAPDGKSIDFIQAPPSAPRATVSWYSMPVDGGIPTSGTGPSQTLRPFRVANGQAFVLEGTSARIISPANEQVMESRLFPGGSALAFTTRTENGRTRLYIVDEDARLSWLGEEEMLYDLDWAPDGKSLAFVAPRERIDQVFSASLDGREYRQLTLDPARKSRPRWSPDGAWIAYLASENRSSPGIGKATPTAPPVIVYPTLTPGPGAQVRPAPRTDVFRISADGATTQRLTDTPDTEMALGWLQSRRGAELAFAVRTPEHPQVSYLYAVEPASGDQRRVYPAVSFDALECPAQIALGSTASARITVTSGALVPEDLPLILSARGRPFLPGGNIQAFAVRSETITLLPGETRVLEWEITPASGRATYLSVVADTDPRLPVYERGCSAPNTYLGLPNLPFTALAIPLIVSGMWLCLPRLLQMRQREFWILWAATFVVFWVLFIVEARLG